LQFGSPTAGQGLASPAFSRTITKESEHSTITRALTIPAITYTLNILNANNQHNQVLARPTLIGLAGKPSEFFSGVELDAAAVANSQVGGQSINIQKEIGVKLLVIPSFLTDGRLKLHVFAQRTFLQSPSTNVNFQYQIQTSKDKVTANVVMRYGETLILGGLSQKEDEVNRDGVPGLQDVPGLQYLFSRQTTRNFQSSVLILMTPRPPQYVYQPEGARQEYEKSLTPDESSLENLRSRYSDWFRPYPNWAAIFRHLQANNLYREFRTGDVELETWSDMRFLRDRLQQALEFLHY
ncbi:MAG: type II and III secretion system protein, partial [Magnetospirillum sp.]|nr:type II and III secretion system protein [Magnetospirillum sp.]